MKEISSEDIHNLVRSKYGNIASTNSAGCGCASKSCCKDSVTNLSEELNLKKALKMGYEKNDIKNVPEGANLGLGCGNPSAFALLKPCETVLDLGSGAGLDCFIAARQVGSAGRVIGVDMSPEMIKKARENATKGNFNNVEFRLGEIEHLPVADESIDVIISNCVINLSPDKRSVFSEAYRVLKAGGRLSISDIISIKDLPEEIIHNMDLYCECISGAVSSESLENILIDTGFKDIYIKPKSESLEFIKEWSTELDVTSYIVSATIEATKT